MIIYLSRVGRADRVADMGGSNPLLPQLRESVAIEISQPQSVLTRFKDRHPLLRVALPVTLAMGALTWSWQVIGQDEFTLAILLACVFALLALVSLYG